MGEDAFFQDFESMFFGGDAFGDFDDFDEFTTFLESDTKFMRNMFRDLGKGARVKGKRRKRGGKDDMDGMEDMLTFMMMGPMSMGMGMGMGMKMPKQPKKKQQKKKQEDDDWDTEEEASDDGEGQTQSEAKKKTNGQQNDDEGDWEDGSDEEEVME